MASVPDWVYGLLQNLQFVYQQYSLETPPIYSHDLTPTPTPFNTHVFPSFNYLLHSLP